MTTLYLKPIERSARVQQKNAETIERANQRAAGRDAEERAEEEPQLKSCERAQIGRNRHGAVADLEEAAAGLVPIVGSLGEVMVEEMEHREDHLGSRAGNVRRMVDLGLVPDS